MASLNKAVKELERLDNMVFEDKKSWKPIINDANADSAKRFAKDLNAGLCQTTVLGAINAMMSEGDVAVGAAGSLPGDMQRIGVPPASTLITWNTAIPPWVTKSPALWALRSLWATSMKSTHSAATAAGT